MIIKADPGTFFVFDLDDTLYNEIDFLKSAYREIAFQIKPDKHIRLLESMLEVYKSGDNTFQYLLESYPERNLTMENLLYLYRNHYPEISLREGVWELLINIKKREGMTGIITDGRSIAQRNKLRALGIENLIDRVVISEEFGCGKPAPALFESFMKKERSNAYFYFGDNINKDFIAPKKLSWQCIGVADVRNIHKNNADNFSDEYLPHCFISSFNEIEII